MASFFSFKVAPGVRISASSRGLRTHVGPRGARVHVGGGRTGVSTGAGPFTAYQSLGAPARRPTSRSTSGLTPAQAQRLQEIDRVAAEFSHLGQLHRQEFSTPSREVIARPPLPTFLKLLMTAEKQSLAGTSRLDRAARKAARVEAREQAERWASDLLTLAEGERQCKQDVIDAALAALSINHPDAVRTTLATVFAGRPVRVARVLGDEVGLVVVVPTPDIVPGRKPALTPSGAPTLHQVTKTERNEWHAQVVAAHLLLAAKEAFAHAHGLVAARVVAVDGANVPLVAARVERARLAAIDGHEAAWPILTRASSELRFESRGRTKELVTVDLRSVDVFGPVILAE
ncbi:hypothetical protein GCM10027600_00070 [Nocardioides ginsengisegetis]